MRIEPPPSVPTASGAIPEATAAPAPPEEPPQVRSVFQGLTVRPNSGASVSGLWPNSGVVVLPTMMPPAALRRATATMSASGTLSS